MVPDTYDLFITSVTGILVELPDNKARRISPSERVPRSKKSLETTSPICIPDVSITDKACNKLLDASIQADRNKAIEAQYRLVFYIIE